MTKTTNAYYLTLRILLVTLNIFLSTVCFSQWREIYKGTDYDNHINGVSFISPSTGFLAFNKFIGFTTDSGHTFSPKYITYNNIDFNNFSGVNLTFGFHPSGVHAFSQDSLLIYGDFGTEPSILFSANRGQTWKLVYHKGINPNASFLNKGVTDVKFQGNIGLAVHDEAVLKTTNKGQTWSVVLNASNADLRKLSFLASGYAYVIGGGKMFKSYDKGGAWYTVPLPAAGNYNNVFFLSSLVGYISKQGDGRIYKTGDSGFSWTQMNNEELNGINGTDMYFINDSTGFMCTEFLYNIYKTSDNGRTWEQCKRNSGYQYLGYGMNSLFFYNNQIAWGCGSNEYLLINSSGVFPTFPRALFKIDTTGVATGTSVKLTNYSNKNYHYQWYKNGVLFSNAYNASYFHDPYRAKDTIQLIVYNGVEHDTSTLYQQFNPVIDNISSFTPTIGTDGTLVTIRGTNFSGATSVRFGGQPASIFTVVSATQIDARVGSGASGSVSVTTALGTGALPGFTYLPPPATNLSMTIADSILCKSEAVVITIQNSEAYTRYELVDSLSRVFGSASGNGGAITITSVPINKTGRYYVRASRTNGSYYLTLNRSFFIQVEQTTSSFVASRVNIIAAEKVTYTAVSKDAYTFVWTMDGDASITSSTQSRVADVFYNSTGQKTLTLISTSINGCRDTVKGNSVFVYSKPSLENVCYAQNISDDDLSYVQWSPPKMNNVTATKDNGFIICGGGNNSMLKSRYGTSKKLKGTGVAYVAKYTTDGILSWFGYIDTLGSKGSINATAQDSEGNIYIVGYTWISSFFHFANGDSLQVAATSYDIITYGNKRNGFIIKLDAAGNYLWHTIIADPSREFAGYPVGGGFPTKIKIQGNNILIEGSFLANLAYCRNGVNQTLYTLQNSTYSNDLQNNFILKIKPDGSLSWNMYFHNNSNNQFGHINDIGMDENGNCYVTGVYEEKTTIYDAQNSVTTLTGYVGDARSYLLKFDPLGHLVWKVNMQSGFSYKNVGMYALGVDAAGNTYVTGSSSLGAQNEYFQITNSNGSTRNISIAPYCLLKFNTQGQNLWAVGSRISASAQGSGNTIFLKDGDVYITGRLSNLDLSRRTFTMTSSDSSTTDLTTSGTDFFIAHYESEGVLKRVVNSGDNTRGSVRSKDLIIDEENNFILTGLSGTYNNLPTDSLNIFNVGLSTDGADAFFAKLNPNFCYNGTPPVANAGVDKFRCAGDTATIGVPATGDAYSWTSKPGGFTSSLANPVVTPKVTTSYYLTVTNKGGFIARDTVIITILSPVANAGADTTICPGDNITIGSASTPGNTYAWTSNPPGFVSSTSNPTINPSLSTSYYLTVTNTSGCTAKDTVVVSVNTLLQPTITIVADKNSVCQDHAVTFTATPVNAGSNPKYQWLVNDTNVGTNSSTYTSTALKNNDQVKVTITSTSGCSNGVSATSNIVTISIINKQKVTGDANVPETICINKSLTISFKSLNTPSGSEIKLWERINNDTYNVKGIQNYSSTDLSFVITSNSFASVAKYFFSITPPATSCFQANNTDTVSVKVEQLDVPVIVSNSKTLSVINPDILANYKWQRLKGITWNDISLVASALSFTVSDSGSYRVEVNKGTCTQYSNVITIKDSVSTNEPDNIHLYPNPTTGILIIDSLSLADNWVRLDIINADGGQKIASYDIKNQISITLHLEDFAPGVYLAVFIRADGTISRKKFIKI